MNDNIWISGLLLGAALLSGCGMTRASQRPVAPVAVVQPNVPSEAVANNKGSLWRDSGRNSFFADNKARHIGDIITVSINEKSEASNEADTELKRSGATNFTLTGLFDLTSVLDSKQALGSATMASANDHKGEGETNRKSTFITEISCVVTEVFGNGNLRIEGRRDLTINHENEFVLISGIVRPEDISAENVVMSKKIADARIEFSGDGDLDDTQRPSWINRLMSAIRVM